MKVIKEKNALQFANSDTCVGLEYPFLDKDINISIIEINGRYPIEENVVNLKCKEIAYVIKGSGKITIEDKEFQLDRGDGVFINKGEKYYWEGTMTLVVVCTPAWFPEQHTEVH